jgi:Pyruvate/2-oxoacid:ferredoxin oxidoreductase delta subunit
VWCMVGQLVVLDPLKGLVGYHRGSHNVLDYSYCVGYPCCAGLCSAAIVAVFK